VADLTIRSQESFATHGDDSQVAQRSDFQ
jgi:hypothetical protein